MESDSKPSPELNGTRFEWTLKILEIPSNSLACSGSDQIHTFLRLCSVPRSICLPKRKCLSWVLQDWTVTLRIVCCGFQGRHEVGSPWSHGQLMSPLRFYIIIFTWKSRRYWVLSTIVQSFLQESQSEGHSKICCTQVILTESDLPTLLADLRWKANQCQPRCQLDTEFME